MSDFGDNSYSFFEHQRAIRETYGMDAAAKAAYLDGIIAGMMGFPATPGASEAFEAGYSMGCAGREKSEELRDAKASRDEEFLERQRERGRRSAESRRIRSGSAQPAKSGSNGEIDSRVNNDLPNPVQEIAEPGSENSRTRFSKSSNPVREFPEPLRKEGRKEGEANASPVYKPNPSVNTARERSAAAPAHGSADAICPPRDRKPTRRDFVRYAAVRWPEWHSSKVGDIWDRWSRQRWEFPDGSPIRDWLALLEKFRTLADPAHLGERLPMGQFAATHLADLAESMRFQP